MSSRPIREACSSTAIAELLAQIEPGGEVERIDAAKRSVLAFEDKVFERGDRVRVGRAAKNREQGFGFVHENKA